MIRASEEAPADFDIDSKVPGPAFSRQEIIGNCFILLQAGHETSANSLHFSMVCLAMNLASQRRMQADIDAIIGRQTLLSEVSYHTHMPRLYNSMVGAVFNEQLRLIPAILSIPKVANGEQVLWQDGKQIIVPSGTIVHLTVVGVNRNPRYWPSSPSKITNKNDDLDDFIPERWLPAKREAENEKAQNEEKQNMDGLEKASYDTNTPGSLFKPFKNSFLSFSEGVRACPGRRFAQVEITAVLTAIFQRYSVELDVADWASDEEVFRMGSEEKRSLYLKAVERAQKILRRCVQTTITLQMKAGDKIPMRFVERGHERFSGAFS
jgi:cytochrome P450